jgi:hypothetical protein
LNDEIEKCVKNIAVEILKIITHTAHKGIYKLDISRFINNIPLLHSLEYPQSLSNALNLQSLFHTSRKMQNIPIPNPKLPEYA